MHNNEIGNKHFISDVVTSNDQPQQIPQDIPCIDKKPKV
jgi:hypothetical protein